MNSLQTLKNLLTGRSIQLEADCVSCVIQCNNEGVSQGCISSPTIFCLKKEGLLSFDQKLIHNFVDDITLHSF